MANKALPAVGDADVQTKKTALWPLEYRFQRPDPTKPAPWWSYGLYQGPEGKQVEVLYSKDKARSEQLAKKFLDDPVVGFDMEWPCFVKNSDNPPLQKRIGLIQVANETTVALFHIGLHPGKTTDEIIAPSLRKLIENAKIAKTGVGILGADFARLRRYFGLNPQGAFELSHLDRLVRFAYGPHHLLDTKMVALAHLVEHHLGLPLGKGAVRTSNWSKALSQQQIDYAASDAYAGFMLYHCMNAKRVALKPMPSLPVYADQYSRRNRGNRGLPPITTLMLCPKKEGGEMVAAVDFFSKYASKNDNKSDTQGDANKAKDVVAESDATKDREKATKPKLKPKVSQEPLTAVGRKLYDALSDKRRQLALSQEVPGYLIASNSVLYGLTKRLPTNDEELLEVKGIGKISAGKHGAEWLQIIKRHVAIHGTEETVLDSSTTIVEKQKMPPSTPTQNSRRQRTGAPQGRDSPPALDSPSKRTPTLHTGLSFTLQETKLSANTGGAISSRHEDIEVLDLTGDIQEDRGKIGPLGFTNRVEPERSQSIAMKGVSRWSLDSSSTSEDSSGFGSFQTPPSRPPSSLKRKRAEGIPDIDTPSRPRSQLPPLDVGSQTERAEELSLESLQPTPLTPRSKIFRNKLLAFSKLVTRKLGTRSSGIPIVSDSTLDLIVRTSPRTIEELNGISGIEGFVRACRDVQMDLLRNVIKFSPDRP